MLLLQLLLVLELLFVGLVKGVGRSRESAGLIFDISDVCGGLLVGSRSIHDAVTENRIGNSSCLVFGVVALGERCFFIADCISIFKSDESLFSPEKSLIDFASQVPFERVCPGEFLRLGDVL